MAEGARPIIIIKKKKGHGGHHGGAWKVAYADFVTAMMALFIVLWLMSTSKPTQQAISGYFRDPDGVASKTGSTKDTPPVLPATADEDMKKLKEELQKDISRISDLNKLKDQIEITITAEGLRIELLESDKGQFFDSGSATPTNNGRELIILLAQELGKLPNKMSFEGHTDSRPYSSAGFYSNWELSSDRANAARRLMQANGVGADQVAQVRGFADQKLRKSDKPMDASNRRITVIVQHIARDPDEKIEPTAKNEEPMKAEEAKPVATAPKEQTKPAASVTK